ncbi:MULTISPECIES: class III cytochrome C family protein [Methylobacterium]|uniref:Class III cytochrome C family protein n=1 Tax=Methylobacterium isbiliense TaxID=315478 RepID=A0ABQ4SLY1_9HYPH|nr:MULTISPECIES: class III cytochrome C family protein [Methylobacterium]MBY0298717.1 class III cytochrome C family protein [Methylobacterium sp.]MDN3625833.1 class III cytochrome C family protein [Methylobacterium isbiliense]GJE04122.1 hypothetical protein GMJLKIPL_6083 [Methylobacterium isbiliense]
MTRTTALYVLTGLAAVLAGLVVPYLVHRTGGTSVPGWQGLVMPGALTDKHRFITQRCETCHTPHIGVEARNCIACHANSPAILSKQSTSFHASIGTCSGCHVEHEGRAKLTEMQHSALAAAGFERGADAAMARSASEQLLRLAEGLGILPDHRGDATHLVCATCHSNRDPHRGLFGEGCGSCHGVTSWTVNGFRHPSPGSTDCAQCHQAPPSHYMMHFEMVSEKVAGQEHVRVEQCYRCHQTDAWNNIRGVGWYKHH